LTAILDWGFVGKQVRPSIAALLASVLLALSAVVGIVAAQPDGSTVSDEATASDEATPSAETTPFDELTFPEVLSYYARNVPNYGCDPSGPAPYNARSGPLVPTHVPPGNCACYVPNPRYFDAELEAGALEHQTLRDSLSPGIRAVYLGGIRDRGDALEKKWAREEAERQREAAEHERDEAAYAVFIEEHLRRLNEDRPSRK
jgi:hypothetical protein